MKITDFRIKVRHWFRNHKNIIYIIVVIWGVIFIVNQYLMDNSVQIEPSTTYTPTVSVMDSTSSAPKKVQNTAEKMIEEYVGYCNDGNYHKAFNMLSEDCKKYAYNNSVNEFTDYVLTKMLTEKEYSIQNYSNYNGYYIYEIKYIDNILATGLTNQTYKYSTEKIVFTKNASGDYEMATGNFISYDKINNIAENDYIKIDIIDRITRYSIETYSIKFTNRTDSTVVVADNLISDEVKLVLPQEYRSLENVDTDIILEPGESRTFNLAFTKFIDDGDMSQGILFAAVRVIENYKGVDGTDEERQQEVDNAIAKFSIEIPLR